MATKPLELQSLKWPFVTLAVLLSLSTAWAVYDEFFSRRPWKEYQRTFFKIEADRARTQLAAAKKKLETPEEKAHVEKLRADLKAAEAAISGNPTQRADYDKALAELDVSKIRTFDAKQALAFAKSDSDAEYSSFREARHNKDSKEYAEAEKHLTELDRLIVERKAAYEATLASEAAIQNRVDTFLTNKNKAQKELDDVTADVRELEKKIAEVEDQWPVLEQYWIPQLSNVEGGPTVDRCQNCHVASTMGGFSRPFEIILAKAGGSSDEDLKTKFDVSAAEEAEYEATAGVICQAVPAVAPPDVPGLAQKEEAPTPPDAATVTACVPKARLEGWRELAKNYCGAEEKLALKYLVKGEQICTDQATLDGWTKAEQSASTFKVPLVFQSHPWRDELIVHNHTPEQFGCTVCHGGEGAQTKGVEHKKFKHGHDDDYWIQPLLDKMLVAQAGKPAQEWTGTFTQSSCQKCHAVDQHLAHAPLLNQGKMLVADVACYGCHPIEGLNNLGKRGPTLMDIRAKVSNTGWLANWIGYPKGWRPRTRMPNFWPGAVDAANLPPSDEDPKKRLAEHLSERKEDVTAIAAYLWTTSEKALPSAPPGDADRGKTLVEKRGCAACHVFEQGATARPSNGSPERDYAPNLWNVGDKANRDWLYLWVKNPKSMWPETKMPTLRLSDQEAADVSTYLMTLKSDQQYPDVPELADDNKDRSKLAEKGKDLIQKYGCFGCHDIRGMEKAQKIGADLTEEGKKATDLLDFGDAITDPRQETWVNWMVTKLHTPRIYGYERAESKMPQFDFSDAEAKSILVFLRGEVGDAPPTEYLAAHAGDKKSIVEGERLVDIYGCRNCHVINNRGGQIRDKYDDFSNAPPWLNQEGARVQPGWLFSFLKAPHVIRPWLANTVHMPTFGFSDEQATTLVRYFSADAEKPYPYQTVVRPPESTEEFKKQGALFTALQCASCHVVNGKTPAGQDKPGPELLSVKERIRPDWLTPWLHDPGKVEPDVAMPSNWPDGQVNMPQYFDGDLEKQIEAVRRYLLYLGEPEMEGGKPKKTAAAAHPSRG